MAYIIPHVTVPFIGVINFSHAHTNNLHPSYHTPLKSELARLRNKKISGVGMSKLAGYFFWEASKKRINLKG